MSSNPTQGSFSLKKEKAVLGVYICLCLLVVTFGKILISKFSSLHCDMYKVDTYMYMSRYEDVKVIFRFGVYQDQVADCIRRMVGGCGQMMR